MTISKENWKTWVPIALTVLSMLGGAFGTMISWIHGVDMRLEVIEREIKNIEPNFEPYKIAVEHKEKIKMRKFCHSTPSGKRCTTEVCVDKDGTMECSAVPDLKEDEKRAAP